MESRLALRDFRLSTAKEAKKATSADRNPAQRDKFPAIVGQGWLQVSGSDGCDFCSGRRMVTWNVDPLASTTSNLTDRAFPSWASIFSAASCGVAASIDAALATEYLWLSTFFCLHRAGVCLFDR